VQAEHQHLYSKRSWYNLYVNAFQNEYITVVPKKIRRAYSLAKSGKSHDFFLLLEELSTEHNISLY
jgi:hypothetical protein